MPIRLLLAMAEPDLRLDLREEVARMGRLVVGEAEDGASAVALARELRPDLVIACARLPGTDGIAAGRVLAAERVAPMLLLIDRGDEATIARARAAGIHDHLTIPWRPAELDAAVALALGRERERRALDGRVRQLEEHLAARRLVERAKEALMHREGLDERQAMLRLCRLAMNTRRSLPAAAAAVLLALELEEGADGTSR